MLAIITLVLAALACVGNLLIGIMWWKTRKEMPTLREEVNKAINGTVDHGVKVLNDLFKQGFQTQFDRLVSEQQSTCETMKKMHKENETRLRDSQVEGMKDLRGAVERLDKHMSLYSSVLESQERLIEAADHLAYNVSPAKRHQ